MWSIIVPRRPAACTYAGRYRESQNRRIAESQNRRIAESQRTDRARNLTRLSAEAGANFNRIGVKNRCRAGGPCQPGDGIPSVVDWITGSFATIASLLELHRQGNNRQVGSTSTRPVPLGMLNAALRPCRIKGRRHPAAPALYATKKPVPDFTRFARVRVFDRLQVVFHNP